MDRLKISPPSHLLSSWRPDSLRVLLSFSRRLDSENQRKRAQNIRSMRPVLACQCHKLSHLEGANIQTWVHVARGHSSGFSKRYKVVEGLWSVTCQ